MPGDLGDARFINYILEHAYLYITGNSLHSSFWDLPILYPYKNTLAYSDVMLGAMMIYVPLRFFIKNPQTTLQIWLFVVCFLNYYSFYWLLRKNLKFSTLLSSSGAYLFAFSLLRYAQLCHLQLYTQFLMILSLIFFLNIKKENTKLKNHLYFLFSGMLFALQLWSGFYFGWFMVFCSFVGILLSLFYRKYRSAVFDFIKNFKFEIIIYSIVVFILILPLSLHYLAVGSELNYTSEWIIELKYFLWSQSFLDRLLTGFSAQYDCEQFIGLGFIFTMFSIFCLFKSKERKFFIPFIIILISFFSFDFLYEFLYYNFPGSSAIRASGRIMFVILPILVFVILEFLASLKNKWILFIVVCVFILEQIPYNSNWEWTKDEHNQRLKMYNPLSSCEVIYYIIRGYKP